MEKTISSDYSDIGSGMSVFGTFISDNAGNRLSAFMETSPLEEAVLTHFVTCHGRDRLVNIQSGSIWTTQLRFVNVHFEPELAWRQFRVRLRLIHPHRLGDVNICDPEGPVDVWNQTFTDGDPRKIVVVFHSFFPNVLEVAQPCV